MVSPWAGPACGGVCTSCTATCPPPPGTPQGGGCTAPAAACSGIAWMLGKTGRGGGGCEVWRGGELCPLGADRGWRGHLETMASRWCWGGLGSGEGMAACGRAASPGSSLDAASSCATAAGTSAITLSASVPEVLSPGERATPLGAPPRTLCPLPGWAVSPGSEPPTLDPAGLSPCSPAETCCARCPCRASPSTLATTSTSGTSRPQLGLSASTASAVLASISRAWSACASPLSNLQPPPASPPPPSLPEEHPEDKDTSSAPPPARCRLLGRSILSFWTASSSSSPAAGDPTTQSPPTVPCPSPQPPCPSAPPPLLP